MHVTPDETMETDAEAIKANMQVLLQRLRSPPGRRRSGLAHWHWLFQSVFCDGPPRRCVVKVCVACSLTYMYYRRRLDIPRRTANRQR